MILENIVVGSYMVNCYITGDAFTKEVLIIDPGYNTSGIKEIINQNNFKPVSIILTHGHGDHIGSVLDLKNFYNIPVYIHKFDKEYISNGEKNYTKMMFGKTIEFEADKYLSDGDVIKIGNLDYEIIHTPGHTPGGICIKCENAIFTGDTLFHGSIGRTDFPGGSHEQLINSIKSKLLRYSDDTKIYPGHNSSSSINYEKLYNPFLK